MGTLSQKPRFSLFDLTPEDEDHFQEDENEDEALTFGDLTVNVAEMMLKMMMSINRRMMVTINMKMMVMV